MYESFEDNEVIIEELSSRLAEHETMFRFVVTKEDLHRFHALLHTLREEIELLKRRKEKETDEILHERAKEVLKTIIKNSDICRTNFA